MTTDDDLGRVKTMIQSLMKCVRINHGAGRPARKDEADMEPILAFIGSVLMKRDGLVEQAFREGMVAGNSLPSGALTGYDDHTTAEEYRRWMSEHADGLR